MGLAFSVLQGGIFLAYVVFCAVKVGEVASNSFEFFRVFFSGFAVRLKSWHHIAYVVGNVRNVLY